MHYRLPTSRDATKSLLVNELSRMLKCWPLIVCLAVCFLVALQGCDGGSRSQGDESIQCLIRAESDLPTPVQPKFATDDSLTEELPEQADVTDLIRDLKDADPRVRSSAAFRIAELRLRGRAAIPALISTIADDEDEPNSNAARALSGMGPLASGAIPTLIDAFVGGKLSSNDTQSALSMIGGVRAFLPMLSHRNSETRETGLRWLTEFDRFNGMAELERKEIAQAATSLLDDREENIRFYAMLVLSRCGSDASIAIPKLIHLLNGGTERDQSEAIGVLSSIGPLSQPAVPTLVALLNENRLVTNVLNALAAIGPNAEAAVPALVDLFKSDKADSLHKRKVIVTLGRIGPKSEPSVAMISLYAKESTDPMVRLETLQSLSRIGSKATDGIDFVVNMLESEAVRLKGQYKGEGRIVQFGTTADIRGIACWTLVQIGEPSVDRLVQLLASDDRNVGDLAAICLAQIGPVVLPQITDVVSRGGTQEKLSGVQTLTRLVSEFPGRHAPQVSLCGKLLVHDDFEVRLVATGLADALGDSAQTLKAQLIGLAANDPSKAVREKATSIAERLSGNVKMGGLWRNLPDHDRSIDRIAVSPDETVLAAMSQREIRLWRGESGVPYCQINVNAVLRGIAFSPDGSLIAGGDSKGVVWIWKSSNGRLVRVFQTSGTIENVAFSPCGTMVALTGNSPPQLWVVDSQVYLGKYKSPNIDSLGYVNEGRILTGNTDNEVIAIDVESGKLLGKVIVKGTVASVAIPSQAKVAVAGMKVLGIWDMAAQQLSPTTDLPATATSLAATSDGRLVAVGLNDGKLMVFRSADLSILVEVDTGNDAIKSLAFLSNGKYVTSTTAQYSDRGVKVWKVTE